MEAESCFLCYLSEKNSFCNNETIKQWNSSPLLFVSLIYFCTAVGRNIQTFNLIWLAQDNRPRAPALPLSADHYCWLIGVSAFSASFRVCCTFVNIINIWRYRVWLGPTPHVRHHVITSVESRRCLRLGCGPCLLWFPWVGVRGHRGGPWLPVWGPTCRGLIAASAPWFSASCWPSRGWWSRWCSLIWLETPWNVHSNCEGPCWRFYTGMLLHFFLFLKCFRGEHI